MVRKEMNIKFVIGDIIMGNGQTYAGTNPAIHEGIFEVVNTSEVAGLQQLECKMLHHKDGRKDEVITAYAFNCVKFKGDIPAEEIKGIPLENIIKMKRTLHINLRKRGLKHYIKGRFPEVRWREDGSQDMVNKLYEEYYSKDKFQDIIEKKVLPSVIRYYFGEFKWNMWNIVKFTSIEDALTAIIKLHDSTDMYYDDPIFIIASTCYNKNRYHDIKIILS